MSHNYQLQFPIENIPMNWNNIHIAILIAGLIEFMLLYIFMDTKRIHSFFSEFQSSVISSNENRDHSVSIENRDALFFKNQENTVNESVCREEMELVLRNLGMFSSSDESKIPEKMEADEICKLLEEKNLSLDEVKQTFDVFDKNRDGCIDAEELQSVLCDLGFKEGLEMENCRRMIGVFDENDDGRIDFDEFVKFMESNLC